MDQTKHTDGSATKIERQTVDADRYGLTREEANSNRGAGWSVALKRRGHKIVRLFKDSLYGSSEASYCEARAYRDAVISALPPPTNHEQAVQIRKNNQSGISGVRRIETETGDAWQATLMTNDGQKRKTFPIANFGEDAAKSMAMAQRLQWLKGLPVKHLAYAHHAEEISRQNFPEHLVPLTDAFPQAQMSDEEMLARLAVINARFDVNRPPRLRVRVKRYVKERLSISISDAGQPAQRRLIQLNTGKFTHDEILSAANARISEIVAELYSVEVARWFEESHGSSLLAANKLCSSGGVNVLVWIPSNLV
ncbi:hypothetical protein [Rhizobium sp. P44RR-XXIV]|uniref:hypothetical protein n=1 Tax=Rhizobium sp. P44RR-XXIV TaxID=1921145 RepID=UPI0010AA0FD3|nr:hypothetical protein [Rhizobium sp. P44RR-XXIV]TIX90810.1 hypothetical protein BSK43_016350 [Rhizobium sp. P44RR-XXIV]